MGVILSKISCIFESLRNDPARILLLGLDSVGKTTILYKMHINSTLSTLPTIGFNVETLEPIEGLRLHVWDIGGQDKLRGIWKFYIKNCEGLFYVVDSSDRERIELARNELYNLLDFEDMKQIPVIIIANKQDIETSMTLNDIETLMKLNEIQNPYHLYGTCATTGEGLLKAFSHMTELVKENRGLV